MKRILLILAIVSIPFSAFAQKEKKEQITKTGFSFGGIPIVAFDNDKGFQYGALCNIYDFGKGGWYPNPRQQWYVEASLFAKDGHAANSQLFTITYDNRFLIPGVRFSFAAQFTNEKALDFYGFNGYQSFYDATLPTAYYKMSRKVPYGKIDFTGKITDKFFWKAGYHFKYFILDTFDSESLHNNPDVPFGMTLFQWYEDLGVIDADEYKGGMSSSIRAGLMYDSRDVENAPTKGIWAEADAEYAPGWMGTNKPYGKYYAAFRHYVPIPNDKLVFAMRGNVQGFIGDPAFYMLPFETILGPTYDKDGFGGYRTIRGILRNRIQGQSICYFNTELRWKFINTTIFNQNISLGLSAFLDGGRVLKNYHDLTEYPFYKGFVGPYVPDQLKHFNTEKMHLAAGAGFRFIMNQNFIIAVEYGKAFSAQDNSKGAIYVNSGYLF